MARDGFPLALLPTARLVALLPLAALADPCVSRHDLEALRTTPIEEIEGWPLAASAGYRVEQIDIVRQPIFNTRDPAENNPLFRLANLWHVDTRERAIRTLLLFAEGGAATAARIAESERALRGKGFLYDARIIANQICGDRVELVAVTRDVWSLLPELGVTRTGGEYEYELGFSEINIAGSGASLDIDVFDNLDREGVSIGYANANVGGSRVGLRLRFADTDDGEGVSASIGQPFYAFDARRAWNVSVRDSASRRGLYDGGRQISSFGVEGRFAQVSMGWSKGLVNGFANRIRVGATVDEQRFEPIHGSLAALEDRAFSYPFLAFERIEDEFSTMRNLDRVQTTEDVFLGRRIQALLGYSPGGDGYYVGSASFRDGLRREGNEILLYGVQASGYWNGRTRRAENVVAQAWLRYRRPQTPRLGLHVDAEATIAQESTVDQQVLIGGDSGLRGYPNRFQAGTRRFRVSVEERFYSNLYLLRVLRVAGAAFLDIGRAWRAGARRDNDVLANVGVGLRFESTRTNRDLVYHLDVAVPLVDGPGVGGVEVTLTSKRSL